MRKALMASIALITLVFALDAMLWRVAAGRLEDASATWQDQLRADGWHVSSGAPVRGGWPFEARLSLPSPVIEGGEHILPGGLAWGADRIALSLSLLRPRTLLVAPGGQQRLRVSHAPVIAFSAERLRGSLPLGAGRPDHAEIEASSIIAGLAGSAHPGDVRLGSLFLRLAGRSTSLRSMRSPPASATNPASAGPAGGWAAIGWAIGRTALSAGPFSADMVLRATQLDLPDTRRWPLGAQIASLSLAASLASPGNALPGADPGQQAQAWRDGGGKLVLPDLALHWGPLLAGGTATLGLDSRLQPSGTGRVHIAGYGAALDALASGGAISPGLAVTVKAVLGLMPQRPGDAGVDLPLDLRNSTLSAGKIPLVSLSDMVWRQQ